jgi:hypothetical protein
MAAPSEQTESSRSQSDLYIFECMGASGLAAFCDMAGFLFYFIF